MGIEKYAGRVALVTGASAGIGAAIAQALQKHGLTVVGLARRVDKVKALALKDAPGKLHALQGDVSSEESIQAAFKWIEDNLGGVDILINNAGIPGEAELTVGPSSVWKECLDVNVLGLSICTKEAIQSMTKRGVDDGFIIHINSALGHRDTITSGRAMYVASKYAVRALLEGLRKDLTAKKSKIRVGEVSPGLTKTEFATHYKSATPAVYDQMPCLEAEDVAEAVVYMLSQNPRVQVHDVIIYPNGFSF